MARTDFEVEHEHNFQHTLFFFLLKVHLFLVFDSSCSSCKFCIAYVFAAVANDAVLPNCLHLTHICLDARNFNKCSTDISSLPSLLPLRCTLRDGNGHVTFYGF